MFFNSGIRGARARDGVGSIASKDQYVQKIEPVPSITSYAIQGSDDQALNPAGGQTVVVTGTGFAAGLTGIVGGTNLASVTVVSPYQATFTSPAAAPGSYTLILSNSSGTAAIYIPGLTYSSIPTYTTAAGSIGSFYETTAVSTQVVATSDSAITYSLASGALPVGSTLYANGVITGSAPVDSSSTTYSFAITATDVELQDVTRSFTLTINTDVVTWSSPGSGTVYTVVGNTPISNVTLSATSAAGYGVTYAANALPAGLTLSSGVISGTPTTEANTTSLLTATASTTNRSATNTIYWVVTLSDSFFKYNSLLMSSTVVTNTFATDLSSNNLDITINGDTKPSKFDPFELGYYSGYFDGSTSKLTLSTNAAFNMGSGDFTVEAWVYWAGTSTSYQNIVGSNSASFAGNATFFRVWGSNAGGVLGSKIGIGNPTHDGASSVYSTNSLVANTWNHVAATRASSIIKVFINGNLEKTGSTDTSTYDFGDNGLVIGDAPWDGAAGYYSGYISNARLVKGTALYTTTFTPSTTPLTAVANTSLLTCQSSRFVDNSANAFTITVGGNTAVNPFQPFTPNSSYATYGSTYFDGTGDYLTYTQPAIGTSPFTIECWIYLPATNSDKYLYVGGSATSGPLILLNSSGRIQIGIQGQFLFTATNIVPIGQWTHIALVREGTGSSQTKLYQNGILEASGTMSTPFTSGLAGIGAVDNGAQPMTGYISNFRLVNGTAVYTAAFTPSTTPLTAITNTSLLTCQTTVPQTTSVFVDESGQNNSITRNGNTNIGTFSPLNGSWSNSFDGTGDYLSIPTNTALDFSTGDFTVEAWVLPNSLASDWFIISSSGSGGFFFGFASTSTVGFGWGRTGVAWDYRVAGNATVGVWQHVAVTRSGTSMRLFVNGTQSGTTQTISTAYNLGTTSTTIGSQGANYYLNGYISNLRVVKGTAVYTANFTPSTTPLNSIANTSLLTCNSPSFVDYSPINNVITRNGDTAVNKFSPFPGYITNFASYSGYFDGTGDYLTVASSSAFNISGNFTVEGWYYFTAFPGAGANDNLWTFSGVTTYNPYLYLWGDGTIVLRTAQTSGTVFTVTHNFGLNIWYHIAVVKSSTNFTLYVNGTSVGTGTSSAIVSENKSLEIGGQSTFGLTGYLSNFRVVNGTAVYTSNFTPSTTPLTAIANTSLLTCQSTTFIDNSANALAITVNGNTKPVIQNPFTNTFTSPVAYSPTTTGSSMYFDGTTDYLTVPNSTAFGFSNGDFTIEFWVYPTVNARQDWVDVTDGSNRVLLYYSGSAITFYSVPTNAAAITGPAMVLNAWQHIALSKNSGSSRLYVNGAQVGSTYTSNQNYFTTSPVTIGKDSAGSTYVTGYMSNVRIVKGTGLYPGPFVPSNSPLPAVQNTTLLVSSTITPPVYDAAEINDIENVGTSKLTASNSPYYSSYSGQFDGSGDYLTLAANAAFGFGTGDFTVEMWIYPTSTKNTQFLFDTRDNGAASGTRYALALNNTTSMQPIISVGTGTIVTSSQTVAINSWYHIAFSKASGTVRLFINGTQVGSVSSAIDVGASSGPAIGTVGDARGSYDGYFAGYISNLRVVKGTALYTTTFTPPTAPLTAIANTSLLTCQSNRFIDNSTNAFTITRNGDTKISALQPFGSSNLTKYSSAYFGTKTDYLGIRPQPGLVTFPSDFTFECWVYPSDATLTTWGVWDSRQASTNANPMVIRLSPLASPVSGSYRMEYYNGTAYFGTTTIYTNQWTYLALVRSGTTMTFYVNGVAGGTATVSGTQTGALTSGLIYIGTKDGSISAYGNLGYIADFRITNGYARYTTTFTPPTVPLVGF